MRFLTFLVLCLIALPSYGQNKVSFGSLRAPVDYKYVTSIVSREGESKEEFLRRAGGVLSEFTRHTGFEACSMVYQSKTKTGVYISTNMSHIGCITVLSPPLSDMVSTNENIHSHPHETRYRANKNDEILSSYRYKNKSMQTADPREFSETDYKSGSGYLVTSDTLFYQKGEGTKAVIGEIIPPEDSVLASIRSFAVR